MRTSLGIASIGLLDRGQSKSLHIGSEGLLRIEIPIDPVIEGGGASSQYGRRLRRLIMEDEEILAVILTASVRDLNRGF